MKVIIFDDGEIQKYLHIKKIDRIYSHKYSNYIKTSIYLGKNRIFISDYQKEDFNKLLYDFIKSHENVKIIKVKKMLYLSDGLHITLTDWVSQAMNKGWIMIPKQIIKSCLSNVIKSCKRYRVNFDEILSEIKHNQSKEENDKRRSTRGRH